MKREGQYKISLIWGPMVVVCPALLKLQEKIINQVNIATVVLFAI